MKYWLRIHQSGGVQQGLLGVVNIPELCLLDYLGGWFFCDKATRVTVGGRKYRRLDYAPHRQGGCPLLTPRSHRHTIAPCRHALIREFLSPAKGLVNQRSR